METLWMEIIFGVYSHSKLFTLSSTSIKYTIYDQTLCCHGVFTIICHKFSVAIHKIQPSLFLFYDLIFRSRYLPSVSNCELHKLKGALVLKKKVTEIIESPGKYPTLYVISLKIIVKFKYKREKKKQQQQQFIANHSTISFIIFYDCSYNVIFRCCCHQFYGWHEMKE